MIARILFVFVLCLLPACSGSDSPPPREGNMVLASQPVTFSLGDMLTRETPIVMVRAIPGKYPRSGHTAYLRNHKAAFENLARKADAVLTTTGLWPQDPLYPWARRANIRIVNLDASRPLDGARAGVPIAQQVEGEVSMVWNSPGNFARMADIVGADLSHLYPEHEATLKSNLKALKQRLFRLRSSYENLLASAQFFEVLALTPDFLPLTEEFGVETGALFTKPEYQWKEKDFQQLGEKLQSSGIRVVLCPWEPRQEIAEVIRNAGAVPLVLAAFPDEEYLNIDRVVAHYEENLTKLLSALSGKNAASSTPAMR